MFFARIACFSWICTSCAIPVGAAVISAIQSPGDASPTRISKQRVSFMNRDLALAGFLFTPAGSGPFPAIVWNHGSEKNPGTGAEFDTVAKFFVPAGYVVFAPIRRGQGLSQGRDIRTTLEQIRRLQGVDSANRAMVRLMESEQLDDQLAGLDYLKTLKIVDASRIVVAGCSYGGIESLLAAEGASSFRAAIAISPAALSWHDNSWLRDRLLKAVRRINIPVLMLQPSGDASLEPTRVLGAEFRRLSKDFTGKIYPAEGPEAERQHCFGGSIGTHVWAPHALTFIGQALR